MTDKKAFNEFAKGASFVIGVMAAFGLFIAIISTHGSEPEEKFKVVDKYEECSVVRYTDPSNNWHYFLDCRKGG